MKLINDDIYRWRHHTRPRKERWQGRRRIAIKSLILLSFPLPFSFLYIVLWYWIMYQDGNSFGEKMEGIITAGWIQVFSLLYGLLAAKIIETVWGEYKTMRASIKRCDFETFIDLRDERLSPVLYMLMTFLSASILTGFFSLKYPSLISGIIVTSTTSYVFGLIFFVVREMDDPCAGLWFIHSIPENWLKVNAKEWRNKRNQPLLEKIASETKEFAKL